MQPGQAEIPAPGYHEYWNSAEKKGYSGTAILARQQPLSVAFGMGSELHDHEGRLITLEYEGFYLVTVYTPNSQRELTRLNYRMCWEEDFRMYLARLDEKKPVIVCGDMNVAHQEIDLKNPKTNQNNAGFTPQERGKLTAEIEEYLRDCNVQELAILREILGASRLALKKHAFFSKKLKKGEKSG